MQSDGITFSEDLVNCNGATPTIKSQRSCLIPALSLRNSPFSLTWGTQIWAKVSATNVIGTSAFSVAGTGAYLLTSPDAPVNVSNVPSITRGD